MSVMLEFFFKIHYLKRYAGENGLCFKPLTTPLASMITSIVYWLWNLIIDFVKSVSFGNWLGGTFFVGHFCDFLLKNRLNYSVSQNCWDTLLS